jgi:hypothetical protein
MKQFLEGMKVIAYSACFLLGMIALPAYGVVIGVLWGRNVQTLRAPETNHSASLLKKYNLADINFIVEVDGERVYRSPDYMPFVDRAYRETLVWDRTGRVVVLELMGKRVFAYDAVARRPLGRGELSQYQLFPMPSDQNYAGIVDIDEQ